MKKMTETLVWALAIFMAASTAKAKGPDELKEMREQCISFARQSDEVLSHIVALYDEARKSSVLRNELERKNSTEFFSFNDISVNIWQLASFVSLSQAVMVASATEAGISITNGSKLVVYSDSLRRFPGPIPGICNEISSGFAGLKTPELRAVGEKMKPHIDALTTLFKSWPGALLSKYLSDEPHGTGGLPDGLVELASLADDIVDRSIQHLVRARAIEAEASNSSRDYISILRQANRSATTLSAYVQDILALCIAKGRLRMQGQLSDINKTDLKAIDAFIAQRMESFKGILEFYERQCGVLNEKERSACAPVVAGFKLYYEQLERVDTKIVGTK